MKNIRIFIWKLSVFGGEIFNIFEYACFRNGDKRYRMVRRCSRRVTVIDQSPPITPTTHVTLRKHAYQIFQILQPEKENFLIKKSDIFHIPAQNIDWWYLLEPPHWGGSNEYPQSMFLSQIWKKVYTPIDPVLLYKSGVWEDQNCVDVFSWWKPTKSKVNSPLFAKKGVILSNRTNQTRQRTGQNINRSPLWATRRLCKELIILETTRYNGQL